MNPYNRNQQQQLLQQTVDHPDQTYFHEQENDDLIVPSLPTNTTATPVTVSRMMGPPRPVSKDRDCSKTAPLVQRNPYHNYTATASSVSPLPRNHPLPQTALQLLHTSRLEQQLDPLLLLDDSLFIEPQSHEKHLVPPWNHWLSLQSGVYEIAGAAGSGKTQLALSLCIRAAATTSTIETTSKTTTVVSDQPTNSSIRSIYIALHKTQMISRIAQRLQQQIPSSSSSSILQRIWIKPCANTEDLCELLQDELPTILQMQHPHVRVIILDGIADLFRGGSDTTEDPNHIVTRSAELFRIGRLLQNLIRIRTQNQRKHRNHHPSSSTTISNTPLSVVVLNQVSAIFSESAVALSCHHRPTESSLSSSDPWKPALGLSWSHCIHQRFRIHRTAIQSESLNNATATTTTTHSDDASSRRRTLTLAHSSQYATPQSIDFIITTQNGCQAIRS